MQSTTKNIVQFSPIGFRTAVDTVVKEYPYGHPEQITTKSKTFTETNRIDTNGAGMLGREGIKWTSAGVFTVSSGFAKSVFDSMSDGLSNTTSTGAGVGKVTTKKTVTPTYDSIKLQKEVTTASNGTTTTTAMEILPDAIKVTKNGTTSTGVTQSFKVSAKGYLNGSWQTYDLTLKFTNGILTGYDKNNFPGSTI